MKRTALVLSIALLLSGVSASAMESSSSSSSSSSFRMGEFGAGDVREEATKAEQKKAADVQAKVSKTRYAQMKECCTNKIAWVKGNKTKTFVGIAVTAAVLAIAYKLYTNYKQRAEAQEISDAA